MDRENMALVKVFLAHEQLIDNRFIRQIQFYVLYNMHRPLKIIQFTDLLENYF